MSTEENHSNEIVSNLFNRIQTSGYKTTAATIGYSIIIVSALAELVTTSGSSGTLPAMVGFFASGFWDTVGGPLLELLRKGNSGAKSDNEEFVRLFRDFEQNVQTLDRASFDRLTQISKQLESHTKVIGTCLEIQKNSITATIYKSTQLILDEIREPRLKQPEQVSIVPAGEDELLIIVATFRGQQTNDATLVLSEQITKILRQAGIKRVRVESIPHIFGPDDDGTVLGLLVKFSASIIIWGRDTTSGVVISHLRRVHIEGLYVTRQELLNPNAPEFSIEMNHNMPSLLVCGALATVSDTLAGEGRYEDVIDLISKIVQILQNNTPLNDSAREILAFVYSNMGYSHWITGQYKKAIEAYTSAIEMNKALGRQNGLPYMNRAVNHGRLGNHLLARSDYAVAEQFIDTISDSAASLYFNIAVSHSTQGDTEKAIIYYLKADEAKDGIFVDAVHNLGILFLKLGKISQAIEQFTRVIDANPSHAFAYSNRASAYIELEQYYAAIGDCTVAIDQGTNEPHAYLNRSKARLYLHLKQPGSVEITDIEYDLEASIERQKNMTPDEIFWYGLSFRGIGSNKRACEFFEKYVRTAPNTETKEKARQAIRELDCK